MKQVKKAPIYVIIIVRVKTPRLYIEDIYIYIDIFIT